MATNPRMGKVNTKMSKQDKFSAAPKGGKTPPKGRVAAALARHEARKKETSEQEALALAPVKQEAGTLLTSEKAASKQTAAKRGAEKQATAKQPAAKQTAEQQVTEKRGSKKSVAKNPAATTPAGSKPAATTSVATKPKRGDARDTTPDSAPTSRRAGG